MEAANSFETLVNIYQTRQGHSLENTNFHCHVCKSLSIFTAQVKTCCGANPTVQVGSEGSFLVGKAVGGLKLTTHLQLVSTFKKEYTCKSTPTYSFIASCLIN
jgi:hypothetical protein